MSTREGRGRRWITTTLLSVLLICVVGVAYVFTFAPINYAHFKSVPVDGVTSLQVSGDVEVTPGDGWVTEPYVRDLVVWPPLPPLKDWSVLLGEERGVRLYTPDQLMTVAVAPLGDVSTTGDVTPDEVPNFLIGRATGGDSNVSQPLVRTETLDSGFTVWHVDDEASIDAVIDTGSELVSVHAEMVEGDGTEEGGAETGGAEENRAEENSAEENRAEADGTETDRLERYRPALAELIESISAG